MFVVSSSVELASCKSGAGDRSALDIFSFNMLWKRQFLVQCPSRGPLCIKDRAPPLSAWFFNHFTEPRPEFLCDCCTVSLGLIRPLPASGSNRFWTFISVCEGWEWRRAFPIVLSRPLFLHIGKVFFLLFDWPTSVNSFKSMLKPHPFSKAYFACC